MAAPESAHALIPARSVRGFGVRAALLSPPSLRFLEPEPRLRAPSRVRARDAPGRPSGSVPRPGVRPPRLRSAARPRAAGFRPFVPPGPAAGARSRRDARSCGADRRHLADVARRLQPARPVPGASRPAAAGGGRAPLGKAGALGRGRAPRGLVALHRARGRRPALAGPPRSRRHRAALSRAVGRPGVDGSPAGLCSRGPGPTPPRPRLVARASGGAAVADAKSDGDPVRRRVPGTGGGRANRERRLAPAHRRSRRGSGGGPGGAAHSRLAAGPGRTHAGLWSRSVGGRSTSLIAIRRAPRSDGACPSAPAATG